MHNSFMPKAAPARLSQKQHRCITGRFPCPVSTQPKIPTNRTLATPQDLVAQSFLIPLFKLYLVFFSLPLIVSRNRDSAEADCSPIHSVGMGRISEERYNVKPVQVTRCLPLECVTSHVQCLGYSGLGIGTPFSLSFSLSPPCQDKPSN